MAVLRFLNNTSLFVSLGALFTYVFGVLLAGEQIILTHALFAFFLTWCAYQFIKPVESPLRKIWMTAACTGACINALLLPLHFAIPTAMGVLLTLLYKNDWRIRNESQHRFSLREIGWLKCFATAFAWTLVTSWWMFVKIAEGNSHLMLVLLAQFFWIAALALGGDIRDYDLEKESGRTWPAKWGLLKARMLCSAFFVISYCFIFTTGGSVLQLTSILVALVYFLAVLIIWRIRSLQFWHLNTLLLDGLLILKGLVVLVCEIGA